MINNDYEFKAIFTKPDYNEDLAGITGTSETDDDNNELRPAVIDLAQVESYWPAAKPFKGHPVTKARLRSGDEWSLAVSFKEFKRIKTGVVNVRRN